MQIPCVSGGTPTVYGAPLAETTSDLQAADVAFLGIPWGSPTTPDYIYMAAGANFGSTVLSPGSFRRNSLRHAGFLPELDLDVFEHLALVDRGDVSVSGPMEEALEAVSSEVGAIIDAGCVPVTFGGNAGPASYGVLRIVAEKANGPTAVLNLDAHHDNLPGDWRSDNPRDSRWAYTWANQIFSLPGVDPALYRHFGLRGPLNDRYVFQRFSECGVERASIYTYRELKAARREGFEAWAARFSAELVDRASKVWIAIDPDVLNLGSNIDFGDEPLGPTADEVLELVYLTARAAGRTKFGGLSFMAVPHDAQTLHFICSYVLLYTLAGLTHADRSP